jgi:hypothetical protein
MVEVFRGSPRFPHSNSRLLIAEGFGVALIGGEQCRDDSVTLGVIVNTRSGLALTRAGTPRADGQWYHPDMVPIEDRSGILARRDRPMMSRYPCPCCGFLTLDERPPGTFAICPVCWWEDDEVQARDPEYVGGANDVSLRQARENYRNFGASEERFKSSARNPNLDEIPERSPIE